MAAVADNKNIKLGETDVQITHEIQEGRPWSTSFKIRIDLGNSLTRREQKILFNSAKLCEVHKLLAGEFSFDYKLVTNARKPE
jgi:hypothetical protein